MRGVGERDVGVDEPDSFEELGEPVGGDTGLRRRGAGVVVELQGGDLGVEFGCQSVQRDFCERGQGEVIADGVDFEASDKVGFGGGRGKRGDVADAGVDVPDQNVDGVGLKVLDVDDAGLGFLKVARERLLEPDTA